MSLSYFVLSDLNTKLGDPQLNSANRKSANFRTYNICYNCGHSATVEYCRFAIGGLNPQSFMRFADFFRKPQIFLPTNTGLLFGGSVNERAEKRPNF
jgi:hypothetical protein